MIFLPHKLPLDLGDQMFTNGREVSISRQSSGPLPGTAATHSGLKRQGRQRARGAQGTRTLDASLTSLWPLARPTFVQSDWEWGARVCHS